MIRLVNLKNYVAKEGEVLIKIDRTTPVGNPYPLRSESDRDVCIKEYEEYFYKMLDGLTNMNQATVNEFIDYLAYIGKKAISQDVALGCWCYPSKCHGNVIVSYLNKILNKNNIRTSSY